MIRSRAFSRILFLGGALLLAQGGFSVYPFLFSSAGEIEVVAAAASDSHTNARGAPGDHLFRLTFPRQNATFDVLEGTEKQFLRRGPGHLVGSSMPGTAGNVVVAGHRDTHFRLLKDVAIGDEIRVETGVSHYLYRIVDTRIVAPTDLSAIRQDEDSILTLITCYPFYFIGPAPDRFIVQARAVEP